ncbi:DUF4352 domain-containing protein [Streptomyces sp. MZ04]|uniref:DUF4352 domain-containing protein n=1 Tax=Streptomyces sp. MZ04 TaxID=2559236 RepID=UPI00107E8899|nr:DUF4352 domain-containing protein [Streptomyces sp. MZ04]TGB16005.1 DUF4352 domain-containing protein [Streptomyces sp. MZ04]
MRRVSAALLGACALIAAGGASVQLAAAPAVAAPAAAVTDHWPTAAPSPPEPEPEPGIGATLSLEGNTRGERLDVTVLKVVDPAHTANQIFAPEPGNRYVAVQFQLKNTGDAPYKDSPGNGAVLVDADGQHFDSALFAKTTAGPSFPGSVSISPGDTARGVITFELPDSAKPVQVQFAMNSGFSDDVGEWTLLPPVRAG